MTEVNFKSLQKQHESLLQKQQSVSDEDQADFTKEVREYIEQAKRSGSNIPSTRERDQVRANLRYWANYIYAIDKAFPDTDLAPSTVRGSGSFWGTSIGKLSLLLLGAFIVTGVGTFLFGNRNNPPLQATNTSLPTDLFSTPSVQLTSTITIPITSGEITPTSTPLFVGSDVALTSPANGESVTPKIVFEGAYTNLDAGATIHLFLIRNERLYPIEESFTVPEEKSNGEWNIGLNIGGILLYKDPEELRQAENLIIMPAACFDQPCRDKLTNAAKAGLLAEELPSQLSFKLYRDSSRVLFRGAYREIKGPRIVYSYFDGTSYDLYTSQLDGSEIVQITFSQDVDEMFPSLSPDGTKIVYVKRFHRENNNGDFLYAISIRDGENDYEITERTANLLESSQWSLDPQYVSYVVGDTSDSTTSYRIIVYNLSTNEEKTVSAEFKRRDNYRFYSWFPDPDRNVILFNVGTRETGTSGFAMVNVDTMEPPSVFFDSPQQEDIQPHVNILESGYLLTYIVNNATTSFHDINMVLLNGNGDLPLVGKPFPLIKSTGEDINYPIAYPDDNALYYTKHGSIYRAEYQIIDGAISLKSIPNVRSTGVVVIQADDLGDKLEKIYFDIGYMDAYFPLGFIPETGN